MKVYDFNLLTIVLLYFFTSLISILFVDFIAKKFAIYDYPNKDKIHTFKITNISGIALIPIIILSLILFDYEEKLSYGLSLCIFFIIIGLLDDINRFSASSKITLIVIPCYFFTQKIGIINSLGIYFGVEIFLNSLNFIFTILCLLLLINAFNYIDGLDGLISTISIITILFYLIILPFGEIFYFLPILIFIIVYFILNMKIFTFLPKVFMGDSGSLTIGFIFSFITIYYSQYKVFIHPSVLIWPIAFVVYEFLTINLIRISLKKNVFKRDLLFIFNLLQKSYGQKKTLLLCSGLQILFCSIGLLVNYYKTYMSSIFLFILLFIVYLKLRFIQNSKK